MPETNRRKPSKQWTGPERWQVWLAGAALLVGVIGVVGQFAR